jgi:hypothetical protein
MKGAGTLLLTLILSGFSALRCGAAVYQSDGSAASVQALHNAIRDGDTITLPAGTFTWTTHVTITKGITIQGRTAVNSDTGVCGDRTILRDNLACRGGCLGGEGFFHATVNTGQSLRITGITFAPYPGVTTTGCVNGAIRVNGNSTQVRIDHIHLNFLYSANNVAIGGTIRGVSDHVVEHVTGQYGQNRAFNGGEPYGDQAFAQPAGYGGPDFFFFEDWYVDNKGGPFSAGGGWDANEGGKYCVRHSKLFDVEILMHSTGTMGRSRGGRAEELYNNEFHWSYYKTMDGTTNGTMIAHANTFQGIKPRGFGLQTYRTLLNYTSFFNGADGRNPWDYNVTESDGTTHIDGHPSYVFDSGTITSSSGNDPVTITDTSKNWTPNQWISYAVRRPSDNATVIIISNTANSLSCRQYSPGDQHFAAGQGYEIRRVLRAIDQPGSGAGDLLSGANPTPRWLNQVREGCYSWNNIYTPDGSHINFIQGRNAGLGPGLVQGLDYFNNTRLPGYTPYTYPHPLVTGAARDEVADFNSDAKPDYLLYNPTTLQTVIWYLNNSVLIGSAYGPTLWPGWDVAGVADFNLDGHPDYLLFRADTGQTAMWYLNNSVRIASAFGPTLWPGWNVAGVADFNLDGQPDYLLFRPDTGQTAIWYLSNNVRISHSFGPTLWPGWNVAGVGYFNLDGHPDYLLLNPITGQTAIWYLDNNVRIGSAWGPTPWAGWRLVAP